MKIACLYRIFACAACSWLMTLAAPSEARFLQVDPVGYDDQFNLYSYVANDPLNHTDPSGRDRIVCNVVRGGGGFSGSCTFTPDDRSTTTVTYNVTQHYTDAFGRAQSSTHTTSQVIQGSISQEGLVSRALVGTGRQILATVERNVSNIVGAEVHPFTNPNSASQSGPSLAAISGSGPSRHPPARIGGRDYSGHARDRMTERGIAPSEVENAMQRGTPRPGTQPGTTRYHDSSSRVTVVTNSSGRVVTVWRGRP